MNVAALLIARAFRRTHEFVLRGALGGDQLTLARQLFVEGAWIACPGGALGVLLAGWAIRVFIAGLPPEFLFRGLEVPVDFRAWAFASAATTVITAVVAMMPLVFTRRLHLCRLARRRYSAWIDPRASSAPTRCC